MKCSIWFLKDESCSVWRNPDSMPSQGCLWFWGERFSPTVVWIATEFVDASFFLGIVLSSTFIQERWIITVRKLLNAIIRITRKKQRKRKKHTAKCAEVLTKTHLLPPLQYMHISQTRSVFSSSTLQPLDHDPKNKTETKKKNQIFLIRVSFP